MITKHRQSLTVLLLHSYGVPKLTVTTRKDNCILLLVSEEITEEFTQPGKRESNILSEHLFKLFMESETSGERSIDPIQRAIATILIGCRTRQQR